MNDKPDLLAFLGLNLDDLKEIIDKAKDFETDEEFFKALASISAAKGIAAEALEIIETFEQAAKGMINAKAKALYGPDWQVIKSEHFKISRSFTGQLYEITNADDVEPDFLKVSFKPNAREIETFRETHDNKLPEGIAINEHRGESIRVAIK